MIGPESDVEPVAEADDDILLNGKGNDTFLDESGKGAAKSERPMDCYNFRAQNGKIIPSSKDPSAGNILSWSEGFDFDGRILDRYRVESLALGISVEHGNKTLLITATSGMTKNSSFRRSEFLFRSHQEIPGSGVTEDQNGWADGYSDTRDGSPEKEYYFVGHGSHRRWVTGKAVDRLLETEFTFSESCFDISYAQDSNSKRHEVDEASIEHGASVVSVGVGLGANSATNFEKFSGIAKAYDSVILIWRQCGANDTGARSEIDHLSEVGLYNNNRDYSYVDLTVAPGSGLFPEGIASTEADSYLILAACPEHTPQKTFSVIGRTAVSSGDENVQESQLDGIIDPSAATSLAISEESIASPPPLPNKVVMELGGLDANHISTNAALQAMLVDSFIILLTQTENSSQLINPMSTPVSSNEVSFYLHEASYLDWIHFLDSVNYPIVEEGNWNLADRTKVELGRSLTDTLVMSTKFSVTSFKENFIDESAMFT